MIFRNLKRVCAGLLAAAGMLGATEPDGRNVKMCWAHYVGWGFNQVDGYDHAATSPDWRIRPFTDRSLLGKFIQCDSGIWEGAGKQIQAARLYGIDGFCVDVVFPSAYSSVMKRFYRGAEGTNFKIALCIDSTRHAELEKGLEAFLKTYGKHPNNCFIDGKPVIFVYNSNRPVADWRRIRKNLEAKGLSAYYLAQPVMESNGDRGDPQRLSEILQGFDGFYDFGVNGFFPEEVNRRLAAWKRTLQKEKPTGILCAGITVGYLGHTSGFYRPYLGTGTLRNNWAAAVENGTDWVCLTTWNDYIEHTHFEPSVCNGDSLARINREYVARWRGEKPVNRPAEMFFSYPEEVEFGDDWQLELLNFSYEGADVTAHVRILDDAGKVFRAFPPVKLTQNDIGIHEFRLSGEELKELRHFRIQAAEERAGEKLNWRELYPVIRRPGRQESLRTIRIAFQRLSTVPVSLKIQRSKDGTPYAEATLHAWNAAGTIELLRNGWPMGEKALNHTKKPVCTVRFDLPERMRSGEDSFIARFRNSSDGMSFSNPAFLTGRNSGASTRQPILETGSTFDEGWPIWSRRISRFESPRLVFRHIPETDIFSLRFDFNEGKGTLLTSSSAWDVPMMLGANHRKWYATDQAQIPAWRETDGPNGKKRSALEFDGKDDHAILPTRTMPYGPFTMEFLIRPEQKNGSGVLYFDQNGHSFRLNAQLYLEFSRLKNPVLTSQTPLRPGEWSHVAVVYSGDQLRLYINGTKAGEIPAAKERMSINSMPIIGSNLDCSDGFRGIMGGFSLEGAVREPREFKLRKK